MQRWPAALRLAGLGWYIATCILMGTLLGVWLDKRLDLAPIFTLLGLGLGLVIAFVGLFRMVNSVINE